jgi:hypothetical protein
MARRVFLHIGPPKTGTSFLQAAWYQHRRDMRERGLLFPGNHRSEQFQACAAAVGKPSVVEQMAPDAAGAWDRLTRRVAAWEGDALLSSEHYALGRRKAIGPIMERLHETAEEVHLVVGARDLARQIPADWQQTVKQGSVTTFESFLHALEHDSHPTFWRAQGLPSLLNAWGAALPPERVHVVVLGRPGSPHTLLWERMCEVFGIDPDFLAPVARANESLDVVQVELIRRMNEALDDARSNLATKRGMRHLIAEGRFADPHGGAKILLPSSAVGWVGERSRRTVETLRTRGYHVLGDLDDLLVDERTPVSDGVAQVSEEQLTALGSSVLAQLVDNEIARRDQVRDLREELAEARREVARLTNLRARTHVGLAVRRVTAGTRKRLRRS